MKQTQSWSSGSPRGKSARAPNTDRGGLGSSTGSRCDPTTQLGEIWEGLKEFRHEGMARWCGREIDCLMKEGPKQRHRGWKHEVYVGKVGRPGGPVRGEAEAAGSGSGRP